MIQNYIDLKKINFLIFISFFPNFIFRSNLNFDEIIFTLIIFIAPILFINYSLIKKNILNKKYNKIKILGMGDVNVQLDIEADFSSKNAKEKIEKSGGKLFLKNKI